MTSRKSVLGTPSRLVSAPYRGAIRLTHSINAAITTHGRRGADSWANSKHRVRPAGDDGDEALAPERVQPSSPNSPHPVPISVVDRDSRNGNAPGLSRSPSVGP